MERGREGGREGGKEGGKEGGINIVRSVFHSYLKRLFHVHHDPDP